jgi:hypothetical protein
MLWINNNNNKGRLIILITIYWSLFKQVATFISVDYIKKTIYWVKEKKINHGT